MYQIKNDYNNKKYLSQEYEPVDESAMPYLVDIRAIKVYADSKVNDHFSVRSYKI